MGGCCCCSSRRAQLNELPYPSNIDEHGSLSPTRTTDSSPSTGFLVDMNSDTHQASPAPLPHDVDLGHSQASTALDNIDNKKNSVQAADSDSMLKSSTVYEDLEDCKNQTDGYQGSPNVHEVKSIVRTREEEDVCPTCLEEYDVDNPRIMTKCDHHFHLSCILEWKERSDTCPICDQMEQWPLILKDRRAIAEMPAVGDV